MASKYTRIPRAISEFKSFLDYNKEEYLDLYQNIKPSQGWNIRYYSDEVFQMPNEMHGNLYEGIYHKLEPDNPSTDEEIINLFKSCLKHFKKLQKVFDKIIETKKTKKEEIVLDFAESIVFGLLIKAIYKLDEVIRLSAEDLLRNNKTKSKEKANKNEPKELKKDYLIGIVTATLAEFKAVKILLKDDQPLPTIPDDSQQYIEGVFKNTKKRIKVILMQCHHQGGAASTNSTTKLILRFKPNLVVMLGHAAGNKNSMNSIKIGDILIASLSVDYDLISIIEKGKNEGEEPEIRLKDRKNTIDADATLIQLLVRYAEESKNLQKIKNSYIAKELFINDLGYKEGLLVSGNALVRSETWFNKIVEDNSGTIGLDMETYGVYYASKHTLFANKPLFVSIKSVSDFGSHNTEYPANIKNPNTRVDYATYTSALFFHDFALEHIEC